MVLAAHPLTNLLEVLKRNHKFKLQDADFAISTNQMCGIVIQASPPIIDIKELMSMDISIFNFLEQMTTIFFIFFCVHSFIFPPQFFT